MWRGSGNAERWSQCSYLMTCRVPAQKHGIPACYACQVCVCIVSTAFVRQSASLSSCVQRIGSSTSYSASVIPSCGESLATRSPAPQVSARQPSS